MATLTCQPSACRYVMGRSAEPRKLCRHCRAKVVSRTRGLCYHCFHQPEIRELYPPQGNWQADRIRDTSGHVPLPRRPTQALPGTAKKVAEMERRASRGERLFRDDDADVDLE